MTQHISDEYFVAYIHHSATDAEREAIEKHLRICADCRAELSKHKQMQQHIRGEISRQVNTIQPTAEATYADIASKVAPSSKPGLDRRTEYQLAAAIAMVLFFVSLAFILITIFEQAKQTSPIPAREPEEANIMTESIKPTPTITSSPIISPSATPYAIANEQQKVVDERGILVHPQRDPISNTTHLHTLGFVWIRLNLVWEDVEPAQNELDWSTWDPLINAYHDAGLKILLTISRAPDWARPDNDDKRVHGLPADPKTYADFVTALVERYQGKIQAIEVWQAPNLYYEVGGQNRVDPAEYMTILQTTYQAVKAVDATIMVISGAPTPTAAPAPFAMDDVAYLQELYALGLRSASDAIGARPYGFANPPDVLFVDGDYDPTREYDDHRSFFFRNTLEAYRQIMLDHDDADKQIWPTEFGWPVHRSSDVRFVFARANTLLTQAQYTLRAFEMGQEWSWVGPMFLDNLDFALVDPIDPHANGSLLTAEGQTPTYRVLVDPNEMPAPLEEVEPDYDFVVGSISKSVPCEKQDGNRLVITVLDTDGTPMNNLQAEVTIGTETMVVDLDGTTSFKLAWSGIYDIKIASGHSETAQNIVVNDLELSSCEQGLEALRKNQFADVDWDLFYAVFEVVFLRVG